MRVMTYVALAADGLLAVVLGGEGLQGGLDDTTTETEDQVESGLLYMGQKKNPSARRYSQIANPNTRYTDNRQTSMIATVPIDPRNKVVYCGAQPTVSHHVVSDHSLQTRFERRMCVEMISRNRFIPSGCCSRSGCGHPQAAYQRR
ncbi:hypothetical protein BO94DRAFT_128866 [Aspergillus sclerotioniger CBS 115572]|uniref:Uncharacterized protein n=1 Tax=Aspergillus sclerotioniger CBS 115572 TaxID=1450535 RepID=A0A317XAV4_9EURO|nr:hypothetical protein BO94DRAFT_128866 [Aspergillus sclerotioniger CBS 115572]PWY95525.1 hypothetical protein BO94DRAFT_128866 [Aspergillus sclerotioniger CBS 115572]